MEQIRRNVFETNSSSTHSITMCPKEEFEKWKNGEMFYVECSGEFVSAEERNRDIRRTILWDKIQIDFQTKTITFKDETISFDGSYKDRYEKMKMFMTEENLAEITQEEIDEALADFHKYNLDTYETPLSYDEWLEYIEYEKFEERYTSVSGDEIVAFGYHGYAG